MASQEQRKAETRQRLLDSAALLFAERGIEAVSIDAIAEAADRTSGAVYAHFGGKEGLLHALLDTLVNETASVMSAELSVAPTEQGPSDEHLAALWRTFASPPPGPTAGWLLLEHELWLYASRNEAARAYFADRFAEARRLVVESAQSWPHDGTTELPGSPDQVSALLVALLVGLEMQHRVDPDAISDETAVLGLRAVTGLGMHRAPSDRSTGSPSTRPSRFRRTARTADDRTNDRTNDQTDDGADRGTDRSGTARRKTPTRRTP